MTTTTERWPVRGHQVAIELFDQAVQQDRVGHAYLLTGPDGIGRGTLARLFAAGLLCRADRELRPCGACSSCRRIRQGMHPDVSTLSIETQTRDSERRESKNTRISIDSVRELRQSIALRPFESRWRVAIIEDCDRLSRDAYDALLKTLEEPPPFVVLILIATEFEALPETIRSRCRHVPLDPLPRSDVAELLVERSVDRPLAEMIAAVTRGRVGRALELANDEEMLAERRESIDEVLEMIASPLDALGGARRMAEVFRRGQREKVEQQLDLMLGLWRDLLLLATGCEEQMINVDIRDRLLPLANGWTVADISRGLMSCRQALHDLSVNVQPRLALDAMVSQWPEPRS